MSRIRPKMNDWRLWVLTAGGFGLAPIAPGTVGTLAGVLLAALLPATTIGVLFGLTMIVVSAYFCVVLGNWAEANWGRKDPPSFVLDEVLGYLICVIPFLDAGWLGLLAAFLAFRFFDILKPPPVKRFEKLRGGWGVLADDAMAGLYGALAMAVLRFSGVI
ncbi:MAG: phosphatidylglycerophosphatase A [Planctomycetota bacterium]